MYPRPTNRYEDIRPSGWWYLPGDNVPVYLREGLPTGGYLFGRDRTGPPLVGHSGEGILPMPPWFPAGDAPGHVPQLVMMLIFAAEQQGASNTFVGWVRTSRLNAVTAVYQSGMFKYPTIDTFAKACADFFNDEDWNADPSKLLGTLLDERQLQRELQALVTTQVPFPQLPLVDTVTFHQRTNGLTEVGANGDHAQYDAPWCMVDAAIWTDHMGPCITIGLTGLSAGKRYNALLHSFLDATGAQLIDGLLGLFNGQNGLPTFAALANVTWFVVGGSPEWSSLDKAVSLATELRSRNLPLLGVQFTTGPEYLGRTKAVAIAAPGEVYWTYY